MVAHPRPSEGNPAFGIDRLPTRRAPHPLYGIEYELQSFECRTCARETNRSADSAGPPSR